MKKQKQIVSLLIAAALLALLLCACGSSAKNVPVSEVVDAVTQAVGKSDLADPGENYVKGYMKKTAAEIGEYAIRKNVVGTNIDEFGIFKAGTMKTGELEDLVNGYIKTLQDGWMDEYLPDEKPKLMNAEVKTVGDYVMYAIFSDADRALAFGAFEAALK